MLNWHSALGRVLDSRFHLDCPRLGGDISFCRFSLDRFQTISWGTAVGGRGNRFDGNIQLYFDIILFNFFVKTDLIQNDFHPLFNRQGRQIDYFIIQIRIGFADNPA